MKKVWVMLPVWFQCVFACLCSGFAGLYLCVCVFTQMCRLRFYPASHTSIVSAWVCCVQDVFTADRACDAKVSTVAIYKVSRRVMHSALKSVPIWKVISCVCESHTTHKWVRIIAPGQPEQHLLSRLLNATVQSQNQRAIWVPRGVLMTRENTERRDCHRNRSKW